MNDEAVFLRAIRQDSKDLALRLVYADWLEERDDPRAELVRIEEEMRELPVFSDRYWQLKSRRNELRKHASAEWLEILRYGTDYQPMFQHGIPQGWKDRWRLIREFTDRWIKYPLGDYGSRVDEIRDAEASLGRTLPPSLREFVAFAFDLPRFPNYFHDVLGNVYCMRNLDGHDAVSLVHDTDACYHWAVLHSDLASSDPPVYGFHPNPESENPEEDIFLADQRNPRACSLTSFALQSAWVYGGKGGGLYARIREPATVVRDLQATFPVSCELDECYYFEMENVRVDLKPLHPSDWQLHVAVFKQIPQESIPSVLWDHARTGGFGVFTICEHDTFDRDDQIPW